MKGGYKPDLSSKFDPVKQVFKKYKKTLGDSNWGKKTGGISLEFNLNESLAYKG